MQVNQLERGACSLGEEVPDSHRKLGESLVPRIIDDGPFDQ